MSTIYIVTVGLYSDYTVVAAFTEEERAEQYARWHTPPGGSEYDEYHVEEYECDPPFEYKADEPPHWSWYLDTEGEIHARSVGRDDPVGMDESLRAGVVAAESREAAVKIAAEQRAAERAKREGL